MSAERSPVTGRRYPLTQVCRVYRVSRSTLYDTAARTASSQGPPSAKRGPKTPASNETLVAAIRAVLAATPFHDEGHRKVRARLRQQGYWVGRNRVLRLMRLHGLLAPQRARHRHGDPARWRSAVAPEVERRPRECRLQLTAILPCCRPKPSSRQILREILKLGVYPL